MEQLKQVKQIYFYSFFTVWLQKVLCFINTVGPKVEEIIPIDDDLAEKMRAQVF